MRICLITSCFPPSPGGIERCVFELSTRLKRRGHETTIITSSRGLPIGTYNQIWDHVGHVIRYPEQFTAFEVPVAPEISARLLFDSDYDVLHIHGMTPGQSDLSLVASKLSKAKIVYTHHFDPQTYGGHLTKLYSYVGRCTIGLADVITASTSSYARSSQFLKPYLSRVRIVPMGVDSARFDSQSSTANSQIYDLAPALTSFQKKILYVGKLIYYKGIDNLLYAFSELRGTDACLMIVGEGVEKWHLTQLAKQLHVSNRVFFLGTVPDPQLPSTYSAADVVVLPSITRREAFGIVILEAMASGKPVVASAIPGVSEVVRHGMTGYLVPPGNPTALASALESILLDQARAKRMGGEARRLAANQYDWERIYEQYVTLYERGVS